MSILTNSALVSVWGAQLSSGFQREERSIDRVGGFAGVTSTIRQRTSEPTAEDAVGPIPWITL